MERKKIREDEVYENEQEQPVQKMEESKQSEVVSNLERKENADTSKNQSDQILMEVLNRITRLEEKVDQLQMITSKTMELSREEDDVLSKRLYAELKQYKDERQKGIRRIFTEQLLGELIDQRSSIISYLKDVKRHPEGLNERSNGILTAVNGFANEILSRIENYDAECFHSKPGDPFDSSRQTILKKVETKNKQAHKTIEKSMMDGFLLEGKVFKKESVSVYLYRPSAVDKAEIRNEEGGN